MSIRLPAFLLALLLTASGALLAQSSGTTSVTGTVTDNTGAVVPKADVSLTQPATGITRQMETDETGSYHFAALPPGRYQLSVEAPNFKRQVVDIYLAVNTPTRQNVTLEVGAATETVEVVSEAIAMNTVDASLGNPMTENQIAGLPLEGRNVVNLLSLQPGAVYVPFQANANPDDPRVGSISGARADQSNVTLDGVDVNDPQTGAAYSSALRTTQDSIQEFRVTTSNYGADQGRASAAQVSMITRSGTNNFRGAVYAAHRNTAWSSNEWFNKRSQLEEGLENEPPKLEKTIWGGRIGGPIWRDRAFFFFNLENLIDNREQSVERFVPSETLRDGVLVYQCADPGACPGGTVQGLTGTHTIGAGFYGLTPAELGQLDPLGIGPSVAAAEYFQQFPLPNGPGRDEVNIAGFRFAAPVENRLWTAIGRLDFALNQQASHTVFLRGTLQDDRVETAPQYPGLPPNNTLFDNSRGVAVGYTAQLTPRWLNNFRYGYTRLDLENQGTLNDNLVFFRFLNNLNPGTPTDGRAPTTHNLVNDVSVTSGRHTVQLGANIAMVRNPTFTNVNSFHAVTANGSWAPGVGRRFIPGRASCTTPGCAAVPAVDDGFHASFADSWINILGVMTQADAFYNFDREGNLIPTGTTTDRHWAANSYEFYIQDTWRMRPSFTLTLGVRYGVAPAPWETRGLQVAPTINMGEFLQMRADAAANGVPDNQLPLITYDLAGQANDRRGFYNTDWNDWAPRVAFAWSPGSDDGWLSWLTGGPGSMSVRGGYGILYDRFGMGLATQFDAVGAYGLSTNLTSPFGAVGEDTPGVRFTGLNDMPPHLPGQPAGGVPVTPEVASGTITSSIDQSVRSPYSHAFNLAIGREFAGGFFAEAAYVGRRGRNLLVRRDLAMPLNLVDPESGMDYFTAARMVIQAAEAVGLSDDTGVYTAIAPIPYWENLFPDAALAYPGLSATQAFAYEYAFNYPDHITTLWVADQFCFPACSRFGEFSYFNRQFDSLAGQSSVGYSAYDGLQLVLRRAMRQGLQFDFNYTLSKSSDIGSAIERGSSFTTFSNGGYTGFLLNTWDPDAHRGPSDFDVRHQMNTNWIWQLPFGNGRAIAGDADGALDAIIGGWQFSGIWRWTSGFPMSVFNCRSCWATNWNLQGNAPLAEGSDIPATSTTFVNIGTADPVIRPSPFENREEALNSFRRAYPGEVGLRNRMRGDGYFGIDMGLSKAFQMPYNEQHRITFSWQVFNVTNTTRFDVGQMTMFPDIQTTFGLYTGGLTACDNAASRCMQAGLRFDF